MKLALRPDRVIMRITLLSYVSVVLTALKSMVIGWKLVGILPQVQKLAGKLKMILLEQNTTMLSWRMIVE
ncbi:hypothetical protein Xkhy_19320 [Xanthomonas axonopodis pv. khayae]|nr:hypothetical protein Xkhy_19320 [Xanthomonas axonopodis pv. khayae]